MLQVKKKNLQFTYKIEHT